MTASSRQSERNADAIVERLAQIMEREVDGLTVPRAERGVDSISRLDISSSALVAFLLAVEEEFGIMWDPDIDRSVLQSFDAMAQHLLAHGARRGGEG